MPFVVVKELRGVEKAIRRFDAIARDIRTRIVREAVDDAAKIVLRKARSLVPVRTGQLKRSLFVKIYSDAKGQTKAIIGPSKGFRVMRKIGRKMKAVNPIYYAHLVEGGHKIVKGGKLKRGGRVVGHVAAHPFMLPALESSESAIVAAVEQRIASEVEKMGA